MWWLILPVVLYSSVLLVLWVILISRSGAGDGVSPRLPQAGTGAAGSACQEQTCGAEYALIRGSSATLTGAPRAVQPKVTVVVAVRNEEKSLLSLLESLFRQDYPRDLLEIIIVNDNSTDRTPIIVSEFIESHRCQPGPRMKLIFNPFSGKKRAVRLGIEKASGEIILTTDADCTAGPEWVSSHASCHGDSGPAMVLARVVQKPAGGFWSHFGVFEFAALQAITEAAAVAGHPVMCNAANMSFRRDAYFRYADRLRPDLESGDDMFLLNAVISDGGSVRHDGSRAAAAETAAAVTAAALVRQRTRWASKALYLRNASTLTLAAATAACNAAVAAAVVTAFISLKFILLVAVMYIIKAVPDYLLIATEMKKSGTKIATAKFILSEIIYPFYFITVGIMSRFPGAGRFRGR